MWNKTDSFGGGDGGGGFVQNANSSFSGGQDKSGNRRKTSNIVPVAIKQLMEFDGDTFRIHDLEANTVTVLGIVRKVDTSTTKITYLIDDQTGSLEGVMYLGVENDGGDSNHHQTILLENTYGRFVGALRQNSDKSKYLVLFAAKPVPDMNELTAHLLEMVALPIKLKKMKEIEDLKMAGGMMNTGNNMMMNSGNNMMDTSGFGGGGFGNQGGNTMSSGGGGGARETINGLNWKQTLVWKTVHNFPQEPGAHIKDVISACAGRLSVDEVMTNLRFLTDEGHCFSTVDDDHYSATNW